MTHRSPRGAFARAPFVLFVLIAATVGAQPERSREDRPVPDSIRALRLDTPARLDSLSSTKLHESLVGAQGRQQVIVRLRTPPVARGFTRSRAVDQRANRIVREQDRFIDRCLRAAPDARVIARVKLVLNAVFMEVDASALRDIAADGEVLRVLPVGNYEKVLSETVPYIGASAVQELGFDGTGVQVAVLDSGIDYTHANLGGPGTLDAYTDAYGTGTEDPRNTTRDGLFPTPKVIEGFDFVGEVWPSGPLMPDEDPIDFDGHGTHVADIAGGLGGVAPGVSLHAVKVCSAISTACSGVALIQGMEYAVDPNGDGDPSDHVDIVNMSLGSNYGQPFDDDLSAAVDNATALGVFTVAAAGNGSDRPFVVASPSAANTALSVAQTAVPSAFRPFLEVTAPSDIAGFYDAVFQSWSTPLTSVIEAPLQYGDGAGGNLEGCAPFAEGSLAGKIVLVDRGTCFFTTKIFNIGNAGGLIGIIGLIAPGDPFVGGFTDPGGPITVPGYMVSQANSNALKSGLPSTVVRFDPDVGIPLIMTVVGTSSRGPQAFDQRIKPEIGAPGASVSAEVGTGTGMTPFGGTSGASPMVAGSAALLMQAHPSRSFQEIKALLMNTAETDILNEGAGDAAPITRIGGGEVRVDRALASPAAAWDFHEPTGSLGFGFTDVWEKRQSEVLWFRLRNYSSSSIVYDVEPTFRFPDDVTNGAVEIKTYPSISVRPGRDKLVPVFLTVDGEKLRDNHMNSGSVGNDPTVLTLNEYDGYLRLDDGENPIHLPWHVLPRKAANVEARPPMLDFGGGTFSFHDLVNHGVGTAQNDAYSLLAISDDLPEGARGEQEPLPDIRAVGVNTFLVPAGFCSDVESFVWVFAINTWERQSHLFPIVHNVVLDTDQDGVDDYVIFNADFDLVTFSDGRQVSWVGNLSDDTVSAFFFAEHATNTGNTVLIICGEQVGLTGTDVLATNVDIFFFAQDFYFGGPGDLVPADPAGRITVTPLGERYFGMPGDVPGNSSGLLDVIDFGLFPGNSNELGIMLFTNGDRGPGLRGGATKNTEALLLFAP